MDGIKPTSPDMKLLPKRPLTPADPRDPGKAAGGDSVSIAGKVMHGAQKLIKGIDTLTSPQASTAGNFDKPDYYQSGSAAASTGFALAGLPGLGMGVAASTAGIFVERKTGSTALGVLAGALVSAGIGGGLVAAGLGGSLAAAGAVAGVAAGTLIGGLTGAFQVFRGNASSKVRDTAGNTCMLTAPFISGPTKIAAGIGSAISERYVGDKKTWVKSLVSAGAGAAIAAGLCAIGLSPVGLGTAVAVNAAAGALGPIVGPRFSQLFRNLSNKIGEGVDKGLRKLGIKKKPMSDKAKNLTGAVPASYLKEGLRTAALSDCSLPAIALAGLLESVENIQLFLFSKKENVDEDGLLITDAQREAAKQKEASAENAAPQAAAEVKAKETTE